MTLKEYRENVNPCYGYDCYDPDLGCMIPGQDRWYACPLEPEPALEDFGISEQKEGD